MVRVTEVVKQLIIINVVVFIAAKSLPQFVPALHMYPVFSDNFRPYQLVTHFFMHFDTRHLLFNMMTLFFLGPMLEQALGSKRFLILYLVSALGSFLLVFGYDLIQYNQGTLYLNKASVGASGAIYGVLLGLAALFPNAKVNLIFPPIPIKIGVLAMVLVGVGIYSEITGANAGVGHLAHLGGGFAGFLLAKYWNRRK